MEYKIKIKKKKEKYIPIEIKSRVLTRENFTILFKSFFKINEPLISRSDELYLYLKDRYKYSVSADILDVLNRLEEFRETYESSHKIIDSYLDDLEDNFEDYYEKNKKKSRRNLLFKKALKFVKKTDSEIISFN